MSFKIEGNELQTNADLDFETKSSYSITITSTDAGGLSASRDFTIEVSNANEAPTDIALSSNTIDENVAIGTVVGVLGTTDPDAGDTHTYAVSGVDSMSFKIEGNELQTNADLDFGTKSSYSITITSTDAGGLSARKDFIIQVNNVTSALEVLIGQSLKLYPNPTSDYITLSIDKVLQAETKIMIYDLNGKLQHSELITQSNSSLEHNIDVSRLTRGTYYLQVTYEGKILFRQFIVE